MRRTKVDFVKLPYHIVILTCIGWYCIAFMDVRVKHERNIFIAGWTQADRWQVLLGVLGL